MDIYILNAVAIIIRGIVIRAMRADPQVMIVQHLIVLIDGPVSVIVDAVLIKLQADAQTEQSFHIIGGVFHRHGVHPGIGVAGDRRGLHAGDGQQADGENGQGQQDLDQGETPGWAGLAKVALG